MRSTLVRLLPKNEFIRHVGILTGGTAFAQGLSVLVLPLLTRLYSPDAFGLLATYMALIGLGTVVACLRLNIAIPLPEEDTDAVNLLALALTSSVTVSIVLGLVVAVLPNQVTFILRQPGLSPYLWMIPVGVFLASSYDAAQYWTTRRKQFALVTRTRISRSVVGAGAQLSIGVTHGGPFGLLFGHMLYGGMGLFGLVRAFWQSDRTLLKAVSIKSARNMLLSHSQFPTRSLPAAIMNSSYQLLPILIMASVLGQAEMGIVFLAMRMISVPISLIGSSISQVYLAGASGRRTSGNLGSFTRTIMTRLLIFGAPMLTVIGMLAYYLSGLIFGESFSSAGTMVLWMTPWFIMQLASSPVSALFAIANRQSEWLAIQILGFVLIVGSVLAASIYLPQYIVQVFSIMNFAFYTGVTAMITLLSYNIQPER